jgi:hypothetical protein
LQEADLPEVVSEHRIGIPSVLSIEPGKNEIKHRSIKLNDDFQIVVISHPLCHFSQNASKAIYADAELSGIFKNYSLWLAPQDGRIQLHAFQHWNQDHPYTPINIAYLQEEWPQFDSWDTPIFYLLKHGKVTKKIVGWPPSGENLEALRKSLHEFVLRRPQ